MTKNALVVGLALAMLSVWGSAVTAQKTGDACALLQAAEVQVLAGAGKVGAGQSSTDPLGSRLCRYEWGTGGNVHERTVNSRCQRHARLQRPSLARTRRSCDRDSSRA